ncbi:hypothetical protein A4A49_23029 [Nicotiana attenuata]|uniref:Retrovirus-related Pol polyprotein from transposon TNT 1-94-like beta-barrel domain-containing protein n=1 Tax=Nicotiana attenuata TaxID=49451 RepID=A0A314KXJ0_NICAT|nr:hypothetical protein A4A49_23029 [Nicotiana attenuata]
MAGKCFCGNIALCENIELCKWILDTGATNHMTGDKSLLKNETLVGNSGQVQLPTGDSAPISHMGECQLTGGDVLKDVLCVPAFKFNLISVSKVTEDLKCSVTFFPKCCVFQDLLSGRVKEIGRKEEGMYILSAALGKTINRAFAATSKASMEIWHKRTGYVPVQVLRRIPSIQHCSAEDSSEPLFLDMTPVPRKDFAEEPNGVVSSVAGNHPKVTNVPCSPVVTPIPLDEQDTPHSVEHNNIDSPGNSSAPPHVEETRKSARVSKPPIWLKDYVRNDRLNSASCCRYPISEKMGRPLCCLVTVSTIKGGWLEAAI